MPNLYDGLDGNQTTELIDLLVATDQVRIERIVSTGQASPADFWYDQDQAEFVVLLRGEASLRFEDETDDRMLRPGDWLRIEPHRWHRVTWTSRDEPTVWLAVFYRAK